MAKPPKSNMRFAATIAGCKPVAQKPDPYTSTPKPGRLELTLAIEEPKHPGRFDVHLSGDSRDLQVHLRWSSTGTTLLERPTKAAAPAPKKGKERTLVETSEAEAEALERAQAAWDQAKVMYDAQLAEHQRRLESYRARLMAYGMLVAVSTIFGSKPVDVVITPADQDLLPGFGALLLAESATPDGEDE